MAEIPYYSFTFVDGAGLVHSVVFPAKARLAYLTYCGQPADSDAVLHNDNPRTCLMCIAEESR